MPGVRRSHLARTADVVIENFRPALSSGSGSASTTAPLNERLIYCSITGFGATGPYRDRPGYDTVGVAMSGCSACSPRSSAEADGDFARRSHHRHLRVLRRDGGAIARQRTGLGQRVETSLLESGIAFLAENAANYFEGSGAPPDRATRTHQAQVFAFVAGDQKPFVIHLSSPAKFWNGLLRACERLELADDPRFRERKGRIANYDALTATLTETFARRDRATWLERLLAEDVPCGPINDLAEVFADPQVRELGLRVELPHPKRGTVTVVGSPVRANAGAHRGAAPELGADNVSIFPE